MTVIATAIAPGVAAATSGGTTATSSQDQTSQQQTSGSSSGSTGGMTYGTKPGSPSQPTVAGSKAVLKHGVAYAPSLAPTSVKKAIWAGNKIQKKPYRYGGGHGSFRDSAYDCSGSVSYALHGGGLLSSPLDSSSFMHWGAAGRGKWITIWTNPGHAFVYIAGLRLDTSAVNDSASSGSGPRWRHHLRPTGGFTARHPAGL